MNKSQSGSLPALLKKAREDSGLSAREVAKQAGLNVSNVVRLEQGAISNPRPETLKAIADVIGLNLADVYAAAGYVQPAGLPSFAPYLRSKYAGLPTAAQRELERSFGHIVKKYGYDAKGPQPGEDERITN